MFKLPKFPFVNFSQSGFAPIFVVLLLVVAVFGGTYLVQNRTNIIPFAAEELQTSTIQTSFPCISTATQVGGNWRPGTTRNNCQTYDQIVSKEDKAGGNCLITLKEVYADPACPSRAQKVDQCSPDKKSIIKADGSVEKCVDGFACTFDANNGYNCTYIVGNVYRTVCNSDGIDDDAVCVKERGIGSKCSIISTDGTLRCTDPTNTGTPPTSVGPAKPKVSTTTGGGAVAATVPTDDTKVCAEQTACVYSEGNVCKVGLCEEKDGCGFNAKCKFQVAVAKNCISGTTYKIGDKDYRPGAEIDCTQKDAAGTAARAAAGSGGTGTPATPAPTETPTTREQLNAKCGFTSQVSGSKVPLFAVGLGENQEITDEACKKLQTEQLTYFNSYLAKAQAEAVEAAKRNNLIFQNNEFQIDPEALKDATDAERKVAQDKAKELNDSLGSKIKEAENKAGACKDKTGQEGIDCLKAAQAPVEAAATAAQAQAVKNAYAKMQEILGGAKNKCVKADMGITPHLEAQRLKRKPSKGTGDVENDEARRVLLCSDNDGKWKWRVLVGGLATGESVTKADGTVITNEKGTDDGDACKEKDCGNDAERIFGLHGTTPDATGDPKFPYTVPGKNGFTFYGQDKAGIEKTLEAYLAAAKEGKTTMRGPSVPGDTGGDSKKPKGTTTPPASGAKPPEGGSNQECGGDKKCSNNYVCVEGKCLPPKTPLDAPECSDNTPCLIKNGDGWECNSSKKCENVGGDSCTSDAYCSSKHGGPAYKCVRNVCKLGGEGPL